MDGVFFDRTIRFETIENKRLHGQSYVMVITIQRCQWSVIENNMIATALRYAECGMGGAAEKRCRQFLVQPFSSSRTFPRFTLAAGLSAAFTPIMVKRLKNCTHSLQGAMGVTGCYSLTTGDKIVHPLQQVNGMAESESKEEQILRMMKRVLTDIAKETFTRPGFSHPLSEKTILGIRDCLGLISIRERELADAAGRPMTDRPRFADEPPTSQVVQLRPRAKKGTTEDNNGED